MKRNHYVLDSNFWIDFYYVLDEPMLDHDPHVIVIPKIVLRELNRIKDTKQRDSRNLDYPDRSQRARFALRAIDEVLAGSKKLSHGGCLVLPAIRGEGNTADEVLVDSALKYQRTIPFDNNMILLTADHGCRIYARMESLTVYSGSSFLSERGVEFNRELESNLRFFNAKNADPVIGELFAKRAKLIRQLYEVSSLNKDPLEMDRISNEILVLDLDLDPLVSEWVERDEARLLEEKKLAEEATFLEVGSTDSGRKVDVEMPPILQTSADSQISPKMNSFLKRLGWIGIIVGAVLLKIFILHIFFD